VIKAVRNDFLQFNTKEHILPVDSRKVKNRRVVKLSTLDEVLADARQLAVKEREGKLVVLGNWTLGQSLGHLAQWITYSFEGVAFSPSWFIRMVARLFKKQFLNGSLPAGVRLPKVEGGTFGVEVLSTEEGQSRLVAAVERLKSTVPDKPNVVFGILTHQEWMALQVNHARLHLSFFDFK